MIEDFSIDFEALEDAIEDLEIIVADKQDNLGLTGIADASDFIGGASGTDVLTPAGVFDAAGFVSLTDAATIAVDLSTGFNFTVTLAGDRELGTPSNPKPGQCGVIEILQDSTGTRLLTFAAGWVFADGEAPELSTDADARDLLSYFVLPGGIVYASLIKGVR